MNIDAQPSYLNFDAIFKRVGESTQGKIANSLDRYSGQNSKYGEKDERREIEEDDNAKYEGRVEYCHYKGRIPSAI